MAALPGPLRHVAALGVALGEGIALDIALLAGEELFWRRMRDIRRRSRTDYMEFAVQACAALYAEAKICMFVTLPRLQAGGARLPPDAVLVIYDFLAVRNWRVPIPPCLRTFLHTDTMSRHYAFKEQCMNNPGPSSRRAIARILEREALTLGAWAEQVHEMMELAETHVDRMEARAIICMKGQDFSLFELADQRALFRVSSWQCIAQEISVD